MGRNTHALTFARLRRSADAARPRVAFLFSGQGSQYAGMGRQLYEACAPFRRALDRCAELLDGVLDRPLLEVLYPGEGRPSPIDQTAYTQPALFALEYALAETSVGWRPGPTRQRCPSFMTAIRQRCTDLRCA